MARILVVEDEPVLRRNIVDRLRAEGHELFDTPSGETGVELCTLLAPDLVLTDLRLPGIDGLEVLKRCKQVSARSMVVLVTAHGTQKTAIEAIRNGAYDYLNKPVELKELVLLVERAMSHGRALDNVRYVQDVERRRGRLDQIIGVSRNTQDIKQRIRRLVSSPAMTVQNPPTVLITGETGTGKDLIAHAIHNEGPRAGGPFVQVNCTAVSEHLFESELFGHVRGAFTDARTAKKGLFEVAEGGTLFLDEIGHMSTALQSKMLLVLETRRIRPVGATDERPVNVHVIAATNRDLQNAVAANEFRADLFHRLKVFELHLDPLRQRPEDILPLADAFVNLHSHRFRRATPRLTPAAADAIQAHPWLGNVRELSHVVESALLACDGDELLPRHLRISAEPATATMELSVNGRRCVNIDLRRGHPSLDEVQRLIVRAAFEELGRDIEKTACVLGLTVTKARELLDGGIDVDDRAGKRCSPADAPGPPGHSGKTRRNT